MLNATTSCKRIYVYQVEHGIFARNGGKWADSWQNPSDLALVHPCEEVQIPPDQLAEELSLETKVGQSDQQQNVRLVMQVIYENCKKNSSGTKKDPKGSLPLKRVMSCWLGWRWMTLWKNTSWWLRMVSHIVSHSMVPVTVPSIMVSCFNSNISYYTILYLSNFKVLQDCLNMFKLNTNLNITSQSQSRCRLDMPSRGHLIQSISCISLP